MSVKKRLPGIGSKEMRQILDAYFSLDSQMDLQKQIDKLDEEIAVMMNKTVARRTEKLSEVLSRSKHE